MARTLMTRAVASHGSYDCDNGNVGEAQQGSDPAAEDPERPVLRRCSRGARTAATRTSPAHQGPVPLQPKAAPSASRHTHQTM
eukprot:6211459-Alexandrium_andersonii.AAC.1